LLSGKLSSNILLFDNLSSDYLSSDNLSSDIFAIRTQRHLLEHAGREDLRREVAGRADRLVQPLAVKELSREAEVGQLDVEVVVQQNVFRLQVAVNDAELEVRG
jgi:hypothetical protein